MSSVFLSLVAPLAVAAFLAAVSLGVGRRLGGRAAADAEVLALALPVGLTALGLPVFALLVLGLLSPCVVAVAAALALVLAVPGLRQLRRELRGAFSLRRPLVAGGLGAAALLAVLGLYPPTAWDAVIYHLPLTRAFVSAGGFVFAERLRAPVFPLLSESLGSLLVLAGGDLASQQLQVFATLATAALVFAWAKARCGGPAATLAAAIFLGSPIVVRYAGTAYVDPLLSLFSTAALVATDRFRRTGERRWAALAGALAGSAATVKYLGLFFVVALPLAVAFRQAGDRDSPPRRRWRTVALVAVPALLVLAPWYLRILACTGNPVFPFASSLFGSNPWSDGPLADGNPSSLGAFPAGGGALPLRFAAFPRLPFDLLFARARYNSQPPFSPAFVALWFAMAISYSRLRWSRGWIVLWIAYALCLLPLPAESRYLLPVYPLACVLLAAAAEALGRATSRPPTARRLLVGSTGLLAIGLPLYAGYHMHRQGPIPLTDSARDTYCAMQLPGYRGLASARSLRPEADIYLLHLERLHYAANGRGLGEWTGPARFALVDPLLGDPIGLGSRLRSLGAELLLAPQFAAAKIPRNGEFAARFRSLYRDDEVELFEMRDGAPAEAAAPSS